MKHRLRKKMDPEGNICWKHTGFSGTETMKVQLLKAMGE